MHQSDAARVRVQRKNQDGSQRALCNGRIDPGLPGVLTLHALLHLQPRSYASKLTVKHMSRVSGFLFRQGWGWVSQRSMKSLPQRECMKSVAPSAAIQFNGNSRLDGRVSSKSGNPGTCVKAPVHASEVF